VFLPDNGGPGIALAVSVGNLTSEPFFDILAQSMISGEFAEARSRGGSSSVPLSGAVPIVHRGATVAGGVAS
jgi:hypothetical protein